ncbi:MAG: hypothetical protein P1V97_04090 [Planctomycetota bacterium]|nr:hypothetical protein [Planctomycetota bacterium]
MRKYLNSQVWLVFAMFASVCLGAYCVRAHNPKPAYALSEVMSGYTISTVQSRNGKETIITIVDSDNERLLVYKQVNTSLQLLTVRNISYDRRFQQFPETAKSQTPSVAIVKKRFK